MRVETALVREIGTRGCHFRRGRREFASLFNDALCRMRLASSLESRRTRLGQSCGRLDRESGIDLMCDRRERSKLRLRQTRRLALDAFCDPRRRWSRPGFRSDGQLWFDEQANAPDQAEKQSGGHDRTAKPNSERFHKVLTRCSVRRFARSLCRGKRVVAHRHLPASRTVQTLSRPARRSVERVAVTVHANPTPSLPASRPAGSASMPAQGRRPPSRWVDGRPRRAAAPPRPSWRWRDRA